MTTPVIDPHPDDAAHRVVCQQVVELLSGYLDGVLGEPLQTDVDLHLAACPECRLFLDQLQATLTLLGALPSSGDLPDPIVDLLIREFRDLTTT